MVKGAEFSRRVLDNGLTVIHERRKIPVVATASSVRYGAQYETEDIYMYDLSTGKETQITTDSKDQYV
jgi:fibrillarin-like rRNA methylase